MHLSIYLSIHTHTNTHIYHVPGRVLGTEHTILRRLKNKDFVLIYILVEASSRQGNKQLYNFSEEKCYDT